MLPIIKILVIGIALLTVLVLGLRWAVNYLFTKLWETEEAEENES